MKKTLLTGLLGGIVMLAASMLTGQIFLMLVPALQQEYQNPQLFRPWTDPLMMLYFIHPFLLGIILAWIWDKVKMVIIAPTDLKKGLYFGFTFWIASSIPGMLMSYASFPLSFMIIASWSVGGLVEMLCVGLLFAKMLK